MRVGVIARRFVGKPFGIGRYIEYLLKHWDRVREPDDRFELYVPEPVPPERIQLSDAFRFRVLRPNVQGIVWENTVVPARARDVDVLFGPSYTIPLSYGRPTVVATHSVNEAQPGAHPWWYRVTYTPWYRSSARRADRVIVPSRSARDDVEQRYGIAADKIDIVVEGVDASFRPVEDVEVLKRTRERYFGSDRPYILFVGKQSQRRNIPNLVRAFARLRRDRGIPHGLLLLGPNVLNLPIEELARQEGVADHVVQRDEVFPDHLEITRSYSAADVYAYPSAYDGFSLTVVEALACGTPVVAADRAAIGEILEGCAVLMKEPTVDELADAIWRALSDGELRATLRERGLARARQLTWEHTARGTLDVLRRAAGEAGA
jgi:glycosyltransferase involved in cell wall biosynthesis